MRLGIDATFLEGSGCYTGMGVYTRGLVTGLATVATDHEIVLLGYGPEPPDIPSRLRWERIPAFPVGRATRWLGHQWALPIVARRLGLDLLHVPGVNLRLSQPGVPLWLPCPLAVTIHDAIPVTYYGRIGPPLPWRLRLGYRLAILAARRARIVFTVSETSRRDLVNALGLNSRRVQVVYNGLDTPAPPDKGAERAALARLGIDPPYLLYAGSYEPRKNLIGAVAAYRQALDRQDLPPLVLIVERESGHRTAALAAVAAFGVSKHLHFVHSLSDTDLTALYRQAQLFVYPSLAEGFGFAPLQALALGVPVVAARAGALPEVLGDAARFADPLSVENLASAIVELLDRPGEREALAARGPARAARFRWDVAARGVLDGYRAALATPGGCARTGET